MEDRTDLRYYSELVRSGLVRYFQGNFQKYFFNFLSNTKPIKITEDANPRQFDCVSVDL